MTRSVLSRSALGILRRVGNILLTLLVIAYITLFGLSMAARGREGRPAEPLSAGVEALRDTGSYLLDHPSTYFWHKEHMPALGLVLTTFSRSAGLLLVSLGVAAAIGVPLGIAAALARRRVGAPLVLLLSILGVSTPSFLLAMLLWVVNIQAHRTLGVTALPAAGFGWDAHMVMPALVLAMRPLAQIAQVTYVSMSDVLGQDYIRTARAKGLSWRIVRNRHALRNVLIPILNTLGASLRFSLASLPVVEFFFHWSGVGLTFLEAIEQGQAALVTDLTVSLGFLFLVINLLLEFLFPILDPRLRRAADREEGRERRTWRERWEGFAHGWVGLWEDVRAWVPVPGLWQVRPKLSPLPVIEGKGKMEAPDRRLLSRTQLLLRAVFGNPALLLGTVLVVGFIVLALSGSQMTEANAYELHGVMIIDGEIGAPPYPPSSVFPWGTDHLGRDVQALVLAGAKQTLTLAFLGMVVRLLLGTVLGLLAGWWRRSWVDRLVTGAVGVWAAFPATLFAMLLIQALGVKQGMWVFIVAMAVVGWGEVAQFVRGQVITVKPELYIEAARSMGSRVRQILVRHVLPHLVPPLLVLAALEMGGILMLLAELGFLNVFLGGGFKVMIAEGSMMEPIIAFFSDVPEWGALLANIREWWRSYPWMAWYPGMAFFLAIVAFNLFGEGLRRFLRQGRINLGRVINRYTVAAAIVVTAVLLLLFQSTSPMAVYQPQASQFDARRALEHIRVLASPEVEGRETGKPGAQRAAEYIAEHMREIGLLPAGANDTFIQAYPMPRGHLMEMPRMEILDEQGNVAEELVYRQDFVEYAGSPTYGEGGEAMISDARTYGENEGAIVGLALGPYPEEPERTDGMMPGHMGHRDPYFLRSYYLDDYVLVVREDDIAQVNMDAVGSVLIVTTDPVRLERRFLYKGLVWSWHGDEPVFYINEEVADRLLATAGTSLAEFDRLRAGLSAGEVAVTDPGATVYLSAFVADDVEEQYVNVLGFIPGAGAEWGVEGAWMDRTAMDSQVIVVSAYYDGLGVGPDGRLYPGANDNASGVAAMLEIARVLKEGGFQPKKTVLFIAWAGGERSESLSLSNVMSAKLGFDLLSVEAIIELAGVGAGTGREIALAPDSSYRLVQIFQDAAGRVGASTTTRGRGPHYGIVPRFAVGGRQALGVELSWDGSDRTAHTPADTVEAIDPEKLEKVGRTVLLAVTYMSREDYLGQLR